MNSFDLIGGTGGAEPAAGLATCTGNTPPPAPRAVLDDDGGGLLPPYSGTDAVCPKCLYGDAATEYRPKVIRVTVDEFNGSHVRRGPLPERLERRCTRCDYRWDEALVTDTDGMTVDALAHALDNALPYPVELDRPVLDATAAALLEMLRVVARPDHPLWQYSQGTPRVPATPTPCEELHLTDDDEAACEQRRAPKEATR